MRAWSLERGLLAPFDVSPFTWFNSNGLPGGFLYLNALGPLVDTMRGVFTGWWADGAEVEIWGSEVGISSEQNPSHVFARRVETPSGTCYGHLGDEPGVDPATAESGVAGCLGAGAEDFEYRMDPRDAARLYGGLVEDGDTWSFACGAPWDGEGLASGAPEDPADPDSTWSGAGWPPSVFVTPLEQARQVWMRIPYMLGLGLERVFWHTQEEIALNNDGGPSIYYSYGTTEDTAVTSVADTAGCRLSEDLVAFRNREKKPSACALQRLTRTIGTSTWAEVVPRFDGLDAVGGEHNRGFYAVGFRRGGEQADSLDRPHALVGFTDAQVTVRLADLGASAPPDADRRALLFVPRGGAAAPPPVRVATVPGERVLLPSNSRLADACLDAGEEPVQLAGPEAPGYGGYLALRFAADEEVAWQEVDLGAAGVVPGARLDLVSDQDPVLWLLPVGTVWWDDPDGGPTALRELEGG